MKKKRIWAGLLVLAAVFLAGCAEKELLPNQKEGVLIYACMNPQDRMMQSYVNLFNKDHEDVQIEVRDYSGEEGIQRLLVELAVGQVPDIMDLHMIGETGDILPYGNPLDKGSIEYGQWLPYRQLAQRGYLEDLWPYIENDPELGRDGVLEAPLKAAEVNGGLYMLFKEVSITTLIGPERIVGNRYGWTLEELMETFAAMPEESTILRYNATKKDIFYNLLCFSLERFVDEATGQCSFDCEEFRGILSFLEQFPMEFETPLSSESVEEELNWRVLNGKQMLEAQTFHSLFGVCGLDTYFGERAAFVGYPTSDGTYGSFFIPHGSKLAMSSTCQNKEAAWEFIRRLILTKYSFNRMKEARRTDTVDLPINREDYEMMKRVDIRYKEVDQFPRQWFSCGPVFRIDLPTEEDAQRLDTIINNTTQIRIPDSSLSDIVWEALGPYFAGDKTMDDTLRLLDNRVSLYLNEQK